MSAGIPMRKAMGELSVAFESLPSTPTATGASWTDIADDDVLAVVLHSTALYGASGIRAPSGAHVAEVADARLVASGFVALHGDERAEVWRVRGPVRTGVSGALRYAANGDYLFAQRPLPADIDIAQATQAAYTQLLHECRALGYPHLIRVWNLLTEINQGAGDNECYRRFNNGRFAGFVAAGRLPTYPAATAIGRDEAPPLIYFLAAREPPQLIENPEQVSAFRYPREHGPTSPSFSRAALAQCGSSYRLFVSGTSSILGHRSCHVGDLTGQLELTLQNLAAVATAAGAPTPPFAQPASRAPSVQAMLRVYVREPADAKAVAELLVERVPLDTPYVLLRADICRRELLVEIEAVISWPCAHA